MIKFKRSVACFLLLTSVFIMLAYTHSFAQEKSLPRSDYSQLRLTGSAVVTQIIDQQHISLQDGRIIYLSGLDFPDYHPYEVGEFALTTVKILRDMLIGEKINLYQTQKKSLGRTNRMGHYIAHIERKRDGAWIQGTLLSLGLARVRTTKRNRGMAVQMYQLEHGAQALKIGVWGKVETGISTPKTAIERIDSFAIIDGVITSAAMRNNQLYLNFGQDWREDFTIVIGSKDKRLFTKAGIDPLQWNGQALRVRGWVESYNGPMIRVDHPERIELLRMDKPDEQ